MQLQIFNAVDNDSHKLKQVITYVTTYSLIYLVNKPV
jgi:hypothetical protein